MNTTATRKPVQERSRKTEQALLDSLEALLSDKPIHELTVAEIAAHAGVTTGAIYRRFKDKNDLLRAAFSRFQERTEESNRTLASRLSGLSDREVLRWILQGTLDFTLEHIPLMRAASTLNDLPSFDRMREARVSVADIVATELSSSPLGPRDRQHRMRFIMRTATALYRDTFLAGPGASISNQKGSQRLIEDLMDMAIPYLQITD